MDKKPAKQPWKPKMQEFPPLILDDHVTEWAARIKDDDQITADDEREEQRPTDTRSGQERGTPGSSAKTSG